MYEVINPAYGCITTDMWRVVRNGVLVALFVSRADAIKWMEDQGK